MNVLAQVTEKEAGPRGAKRHWAEVTGEGCDGTGGAVKEGEGLTADTRPVAEQVRTQIEKASEGNDAETRSDALNECFVWLNEYLIYAMEFSAQELLDSSAYADVIDDVKAVVDYVERALEETAADGTDVDRELLNEVQRLERLCPPEW